MKHTIVVLETSDIGARYTAEAIRSLGYAPLFLVDLKAYQADTRRQLAELDCVQCDTTDVAAIVAAVRSREISLAGLLTFLDSRLSMAVEAARILETPGLDPAVLALKDKGAVARLVPEWSPPTLAFHRDHIPIGQIKTLLSSFPRLVLKPTRAAGAVGCSTITADNVDRIPELIAGAGVAASLDQGDWVAQAFAEGSLVSAEGFVRNGRTRVIGLTDREKIGQTESQARFPVDERVARLEREGCRDAVELLVERSGFRNGYFHAEFILHASGPLLIDANFGRLGGGSVGEQLAHAFGLAPHEVFRHVIEVSLYPARTPARHDLYDGRPVPTLGILYGLRAAGHFERVRVPAGPGYHHTQILDEGQAVAEMGVNNWSWIGILAGDARRVREAAAGVRVRVDGRDQDACF